MSRDQNTSHRGDILVVDDRADNLRLLSTMLSEQDYKVRKVIKGELTLDVAQINPPDLILLDIMMPNINGFEVCQQLKASERTCMIPVIFLSASNETLDKVKAFSVGGEDYITKPFEIQEVVARIEHQLHIVRLQRQLRDQNYQLQAEITERQKAEAALQQINDELEERVQQRTVELTHANQQLQEIGQKLQLSLTQEQKLSQLKSQIITTISHEYRTPMAVISSSVGVLEDYADRLKGELRHKHFKRIQKAIQRMTELIDDVIFINQLEFEKLAPNLEVVDLEKLVNEAIFEVSSETSQAIKVSIDSACEWPISDRLLLMKILLNLLNNATKFSSPNSSINLEISCPPKQLLLTVTDSGIGIPKEDLGRIFESFYRARNTNNIQGIGLGLSIVKKCVSLLDGKLLVSSTLDSGTTVKVSLPQLESIPSGI